MCEKPYWYIGNNFDEPFKIEEVNFSREFQDDEILCKTKETLGLSLIHKKNFAIFWLCIKFSIII